MASAVTAHHKATNIRAATLPPHRVEVEELCLQESSYAALAKRVVAAKQAFRPEKIYGSLLKQPLNASQVCYPELMATFRHLDCEARIEPGLGGGLGWASPLALVEGLYAIKRFGSSGLTRILVLGGGQSHGFGTNYRPEWGARIMKAAFGSAVEITLSDRLNRKDDEVWYSFIANNQVWSGRLGVKARGKAGEERVKWTDPRFSSLFSPLVLERGKYRFEPVSPEAQNLLFRRTKFGEELLKKSGIPELGVGRLYVRPVFDVEFEEKIFGLKTAENASYPFSRQEIERRSWSKQFHLVYGTRQSYRSPQEDRLCTASLLRILQPKGIGFIDVVPNFILAKDYAGSKYYRGSGYNLPNVFETGGEAYNRLVERELRDARKAYQTASGLSGN